MSVNAIGFADIISLLLQITADVSKNTEKSHMTWPLFSLNFQKILTVLCKCL